LRRSFEEFLKGEFSADLVGPLTQQVFQRAQNEILDLFSNQELVWETTGESLVQFSGLKASVNGMSIRLKELIAKHEKEISEESNIKQEKMSNIAGYQMDFFRKYDIFSELCNRHKLKNVSEIMHAIEFTGLPTRIEQAQKEVLSLLDNLRVSTVESPIEPTFLDVFQSPMAQSSIENALVSDNVQAVWHTDHTTLSVYSVSKLCAENAFGIITTTVWQAYYPQGREFDDQEQQILSTIKWRDWIDNLTQRYQPLKVDPIKHGRQLSLAGLQHHKASVLEDIPMFFTDNVRRELKVKGNSNKIRFINMFQKDVVKEWELKHKVSVKFSDDFEFICIEGTKHNVANCQRTFLKQLDGVCEQTVEISDPARVKHIREDNFFHGCHWNEQQLPSCASFSLTNEIV